MATNNPIPLFLSQQSEQPAIGTARDRAGITSRTLRTSILFVTAVAIVFVVLLFGDPLALFTSAMASLISPSPQIGTRQSGSTIQSTASAQALLPTAGVPQSNEIDGAVKTDYQRQPEISRSQAGALFKQFQAWAAEQDARATVRPLATVQEAKERDVQRRAQDQPTKPRRARPMHDAWADVRPGERHRQIRSERTARAHIRPKENARVQDQSSHEATWPERSFGWLY